MALRIPEIDSATVAIVGSFNPSIFQPQWFARQGLLPPAEADAAEIKLLVPQICQFETERFIVQVTNDRFAASSRANASSPPLRDLVIGTFFILEHTPVTAIGLNREMHIPTESEEQWHRLGDKLVPKEGWQGILEGRVGMLSLDVTVEKTGQAGARVNVKVQPSVRVKFGAYFLINEDGWPALCCGAAAHSNGRNIAPVRTWIGGAPSLMHFQGRGFWFVLRKVKNPTCHAA